MTVLRVAVTGAAGQMGREVVKALRTASDMKLVAAVSPRHAGQDAGEVAGIGRIGLFILPAIEPILSEVDVVIDFTSPAAVMGVARRVLGHRVHAVIGSTGLVAEDLAELDALARGAGVGCLVAPNFAVGALLMIEFAARAAKYFDHAEIVERHHNRKVDAPSGTALRTAEAMTTAREQFGATTVQEHESLLGARGGDVAGIHIHSVRLPGLVAHQEVMFGAAGQLLTVRHDALSRECYMPGVLLGVRRIVKEIGLVHGLEKFMQEEGSHVQAL